MEIHISGGAVFTIEGDSCKVEGGKIWDICIHLLFSETSLYWHYSRTCVKRISNLSLWQSFTVKLTLHAYPPSTFWFFHQHLYYLHQVSYKQVQLEISTYTYYALLIFMAVVWILSPTHQCGTNYISIYSWPKEDYLLLGKGLMNWCLYVHFTCPFLKLINWER